MLCFACTAGGGQAPLERRVEPKSPPLRVATSGDYRPFSTWELSEAQPVGFSPDVVRAFAEMNELDVEWVRFRWPELLGDLGSDRFDIAISGITVRPDRSVAGLFSIPLTTSGAIVLVRDEGSIRASSDLDRKEIRLDFKQFVMFINVFLVRKYHHFCRIIFYYVPEYFRLFLMRSRKKFAKTFSPKISVDFSKS